MPPKRATTVKSKMKVAREDSASNENGSDYNETPKKTTKTTKTTKKAATKGSSAKSSPKVTQAKATNTKAKSASKKRSISEASDIKDQQDPEPETKKRRDSHDAPLPSTESTVEQEQAAASSAFNKIDQIKDKAEDEGEANKRFPSPPDEPASDFDKESWQGFCEIESDPGFFSVMVREMGVEGVALREVYSLDCLDMVPSPIYGLILLFRARQVDPENEETSCPAQVWFANQMPAQNSCATLAMINILLNIPGIDIGEHLRQFKEFTKDMTPYQRGETLNSFHFVKKIHNSFAKKQDMLQDDMRLKEKVKNALHTTAGGGGDFNDNAHHFIAFTPIEGEVWKLDGMDAQPTSIGAYIDDDEELNWQSIATQKINSILGQGGNDYNVIAMVQSPLGKLRKSYCEKDATRQVVEGRLTSLKKDWHDSIVTSGSPDLAPGPTSPTFMTGFGITQTMMDEATVSPEDEAQIAEEDEDGLFDRRFTIVQEQLQFQEQIMTEMEFESAENERASERRFDYGPVIQKWLELLANNGYLEQNLDRFLPESQNEGGEDGGSKKKVKGKK